MREDLLRYSNKIELNDLTMHIVMQRHVLCTASVERLILVLQYQLLSNTANDIRVN